MTKEEKPVGGQAAWEMLAGEWESEASRWLRPIVQYWGLFFAGFVLLVVWLPSIATTAGLKVLQWIATYVVYSLSTWILSRQAKAKPLYETELSQLFRIHFNLLMIVALVLVAPPTAFSYLWFFFSMPLLAALAYFGPSLRVVSIVFVEVCAVLLVLTLAQDWPIMPENLTAMFAKDAILGLLTGVLYFFVHLSPRQREQSTLLNTYTTLLQTLDQRELCQLIADAAKVGMPAADAAVVHLLGGEGNQMLVATGSSHLDLTMLGRTPMKIGVGIAGHAIRNHEIVNVPDVTKDERYHPLSPSFTPFTSLLVAPMYVGGKNVGAISVHSAKKGAFSKRDERFLTALAAQGATAIANAELYDTHTRRRQQISDILEASTAFGLHQRLDTLLQTIAAEVCRCSGYRMAVINLLDETSGEIVVKAMDGVPPAGIRKLEGMRIPCDAVKPLLQDEFCVSRSYFIRYDRRPEIPDLGQFTFTADMGERKPGEWRQEDMLIVPIHTQESELLGYISVNDPSDRQIPSLDTIQALEILASVAATAIENAHLYEQAQKEITERKRAEESLAQQQHLLQTFMDNVPDNIYFKDTESRFIRINRALADWLGLDDPAQAMGKTDFDFFTNEHSQQAYADEQGIIRTGQPLSVEEKETWPDGRETWVATTKMPLYDEGGHIIGTFGISKDITERKRVQDALQQRNRELELLNRVSQAFVSTLNLDQVLIIVLEEVRHLLDVLACSVWLTDLESGELVCCQATGTQSEVVRGWRLAPSQGIAGCVAHSGKSLIVSDVQDDGLYFKAVDEQAGLGLRSIMTVPLRVKEVVIGVLQVMAAEVNRFKPTDLALVEPLAATAAIAIENARLYKETDRLRVFSENIVQSMEEGILIEDANEQITFVNRKTAELLGYTPTELIGRHWKTIVSPEVVVKVEEESAQRSQGIASRYETVLLTKERQPVTVMVSATPFFDEGLFTGNLCVFTDITDRKRQETRLRDYLSTMTSSLAQHTRLEGLYKFIVEAGTQFVSARDCSLYLTSDENGGSLELVAATKAASRADTIDVTIGSRSECGLVAHVAEWGQPARLLGKEMLEHSLWNRELWTRFERNFDLERDRSLLAAPMCLQDGKTVGVLVARGAESDEGFSEFDEALLQALATNAAADIQRVRSVEKAREDAKQAERRRLETDLHEAMNVLATGVRWEAEILADELMRSNLPAARVALERLLAALPRVYTDLRYLLEDLRDPILEEGLLVALRSRAELIGRGRIVVRDLSQEELPKSLGPEIEGVLYRVGKEAMSNAFKHSGADGDPDVKVEVWLEVSDGHARICVKDDGIGFDVEPTLALSHKWGLRRLRDMVKEAGGSLDIDSVPEKGTTICATIDLAKENTDDEQQDPCPHS